MFTCIFKFHTVYQEVYCKQVDLYTYSASTASIIPPPPPTPWYTL